MVKSGREVKKVILRPVKKEDIPVFHKWVNDPEIMGFWYGRDKPKTLAWAKKHFLPIIKGESPSQCWTIEVEGKPIGFMYNTPSLDEDAGEFSGRVELDILVGDKREQGKGYGTDALRAMIVYAFNKQKAERVFIIPRLSNQRAIHVYEKVGFKKEGILHHFEKLEGKWIDSLMMAIIRDEFEQQKK